MAGGVGVAVTVDGVGAAAVALAKPPKSASKSEDGAVLLCGAVNAPKSSSSLVTVAVAADAGVAAGAGVAAANEPKSSPVDTAGCVSAVNAPKEFASLLDVEAGAASKAPNISSLLVDVAALVLLAVPNMSLALPSDASAAANEPKSSLVATGAGVASTAGAASFIELSPKPSIGVTVSNDN